MDLKENSSGTKNILLNKSVRIYKYTKKYVHIYAHHIVSTICNEQILKF